MQSEHIHAAEYLLGASSVNYPTTSSSLYQQCGVRLAWVPLSHCMRVCGEQVQDMTIGSSLPNVHHRVASESSPTARHSAQAPAQQGSTGSLTDNTSTGLEMRFKQQFMRQTALPVEKLQAAFPPASVCYEEGSMVRFLLDDDLSTSQWENMESHRVIRGVVTVINPATHLNISPEHAMSVVETVFNSQFKDRVCRCFVVDPAPALMEVVKQSPRFEAVYSCEPIDVSARRAVVNIARAVITEMAAFAPSLLSVASGAAMDLSTLRTPLDKSPIALRSSQLASRLAKKRGDLFLQFGRWATALRAFGSTQFASGGDPLWCASTLESIAAARYQQQLSFMLSIPIFNRTLLTLQEESTVWNEDLVQPVEQLEQALVREVESFKETAALLKGTSIPSSMRQRLHREIEEPLTSKLTTLRSLSTKVRACAAAGTTNLENDPIAYRLGAEMRQCVQEMVTLVLAEVAVYLTESRRQMKRACGNVSVSTSPPLLLGAGGSPVATPTATQDKELENRLKTATYAAVRQGGSEPFLEEVREVRLLLSTGFYEGIRVKVSMHLVLLCVFGRCRRKAILLLVEMALMHKRSRNYHAAVACLGKACFLYGVNISIPELLSDPQEDLLYVAFLEAYSIQLTSKFVAQRPLPPMSSMSLSSFPAVDRHAARGSSKKEVSKHADTVSATVSQPQRLHVPLMMELLDILTECAALGSGGLQCRLAAVLLFRYHVFLDRGTQGMLLRVIELDAPQLPPHLSPCTISVPFLSSWEAVQLAPHLAPKTVSVGGAVFTFIDTARLQHTVFSLNGKKLRSRVVWTVGDVGTIVMTLRNPLRHPLTLHTLALKCSSSAELYSSDQPTEGAGVVRVGPAAPVSYVLRDVELAPLSAQQVQLQVQPQLEGYLHVEGVELRIGGVDAVMPFMSFLPEPLGVPVLQRLPLVSCTISISELEIFSGQSINLWVRVVNCGVVPIDRITLTAHSEACLLEGCEGCMERPNLKESTVFLNKAALQAACSAPLQPGDVVTIPTCIDAPAVITQVSAHFVVFRVDCSLPHDPPSMPPDVPPAVPVFGVIPRRVMETRMRLFHAPSLEVMSIALTRDRRFIDVRIVNRSRRHTVELRLSEMRFTGLPDALIVPGAEFVVPQIEITTFPENVLTHTVPWVVRELHQCEGRLLLDFSHILKETLCTEPLDECVVVADVDIPLYNPTSGERGTTRMRWESSGSAGTSTSPALELRSGSRGGVAGHRSDANSHKHGHDAEPQSGAFPSASGGSTTCTSLYKSDAAPHDNSPSERSLADASGEKGKWSAAPVMIPAMKSIVLHLRASAPWRKATRLRFQVSMDHHLDVGVLTGCVDGTADVGEVGTRVYDQHFELFTMRTGEHIISITITDTSAREITHHLHVLVVHAKE